MVDKGFAMNDIEIKLENDDRGAFVIEEGGQKIAEMAFGKKGDDLIVFHTEVSDKLKGKGVSTMLLDRMVAYAREEKLKVVPLCQYVLVQFQRHPDKYADIWNKHWHDKK